MKELLIKETKTPREDDVLNKYLSDINKIELIKPEDEVILAQKIKKGDQNALEKLVKANLRFVVSVAKQYQNQGLSLSDLINTGNLGLIKAAKRFDETKGFKFISYAVWWIRQSISKSIAEENIDKKIIYPIGFVNKTNQIRKYAEEFEKENGRFPNEEEVIEILKKLGKEQDMQKIIYALSRKRDIKIIENSNDNEDYYGGVDDVDLIINSDPIVLDSLYQEDINSFIGHILEKLPDDQRQYIKLVFYKNYQVKDDIARELGISVDQVNRLEKKIEKNFLIIRKKIKKNIFV